MGKFERRVSVGIVPLIVYGLGFTALGLAFGLFFPNREGSFEGGVAFTGLWLLASLYFAWKAESYQYLSDDFVRRRVGVIKDKVERGLVVEPQETDFSEQETPVELIEPKRDFLEEKLKGIVEGGELPPAYSCVRCGNVWSSRRERVKEKKGVAYRPSVCPACKSQSWDKARVRAVYRKRGEKALVDEAVVGV